jgi:hypothetical protein
LNCPVQTCKLTRLEFSSSEAFACLEKAYLQHSATIATLKVEPAFDPLRGDPRYQDLMGRVGLAQ